MAGVTKIRLTSQRDWLDIYNFYFLLLKPPTRRLFSPYPLFNDPDTCPSKFLQRYISWTVERDWLLTGAYVSDRLIGLGILKKYVSEPTTGLVVSEASRDRGVGRLILKDLVQRAVGLGLSCLHATIEDHNTASINLHTSLGFVSLNTFKHHEVNEGTKKVTIEARRYILNIQGG